MFKFTFSKLAPMGDFDEKYGLAYWGEVNEDLKPVKFNSMNQNITVGDTIECEERVEKQSSKGTIYYQLKKVKVVGSVPVNPALLEEPVPKTSAQLDRIEKKLDQLLALKEDETMQEQINDL